MGYWHRFVPLLLLLTVCAGRKYKEADKTLEDFSGSSRKDAHKSDYSYERSEYDLNPAIKKPLRYKPYELTSVRVIVRASTAERKPEESRPERREPKFVYLTGNEIELISRQNLLSADLADIEGIDLSNNEIEVIEKQAFDNLTKLRKLKLNDNHIVMNPISANWITDKLQNLELLNLADNEIKIIDDGAFDALPNLVTLILDGNYGLSLTDGTFNKAKTTSLINLSIDRCNLNALPEKLFENLPSLKFLSLIDNHFTSIPAALKLAPKIETLDFSENNEVTSWPANALKSTSITTLLLKNMQGISSYGNCAFCNLPNLELIDLSGSKNLAFINENAFGFVEDSNLLKSLKTSRMEDCKLTTLGKNMLPWEQLEQVAVGGNPLNCNDDLMWVLQKNIAFADEKAPTCVTAPDWKDKSIQTVPEKVESLSSVAAFFRTLFFMGIFIGLISMVVTGFLHLSKYPDKTLFGRWFNRRPLSTPGFSNLNTNVDDEDVHVFYNDENEFVARPAAA